ncbi:hypothetical protein VUR80DRAFT_6814 [Thermomyces stellatus]
MRDDGKLERLRRPPRKVQSRGTEHTLHGALQSRRIPAHVSLHRGGPVPERRGAQSLLLAIIGARQRKGGFHGVAQLRIFLGPRRRPGGEP